MCVAWAVLAAGVSLAGCGSVGDTRMSSLYALPGQFDLYTCKELAGQMRAHRDRQQELEGLMGRAGQGQGGAFVSTVAYRSEYLKTRGEIDELNRVAARKSCVADSPWASDRSQF